MKTVIHPKIKRFASKFGIQFRIGKDPEACDIMGVEIDPIIPACYFGQGVIFVRDHVKYRNQADVDFILCHEISHAIFGFFRLNTPEKVEECSANMGALLIMAQIGLWPSKKMIRAVDKYNRSKKTVLKWSDV